MLRFIVFSCCVVLSMCDEFKNCGKNEEMKCVQPCPPQKTCRNRNIEFSCLQYIQPCQHICVCKPGFLRNAVGTCITNEECDMCQRENEYFACSGACDNECAKLDTQNKTHCPIKNIVCNRKCYCEDGFARDDKENCIPVEKCHEVCPDNERYSSCIQAECRALNCTQKDQSVPCIRLDPAFCEKGCVCEEGYLRNEDGLCVQENKCEHSKHVEEGSSIKPDDGGGVRRKCDLTELVCTGENEVPTDCKKSCPPNTCLSLVAKFKCDSTEPCKKGCVCKPGYLRQQPDSPCIPICQCSQMKDSADCGLHDSTTKE